MIRLFSSLVCFVVTICILAAVSCSPVAYMLGGVKMGLGSMVKPRHVVTVHGGFGVSINARIRTYPDSKTW